MERMFGGDDDGDYFDEKEEASKVDDTLRRIMISAKKWKGL